jgi:hypothetical protein
MSKKYCDRARRRSSFYYYEAKEICLKKGLPTNMTDCSSCLRYAGRTKYKGMCGGRTLTIGRPRLYPTFMTL